MCFLGYLVQGVDCVREREDKGKEENERGIRDGGRGRKIVGEVEEGLRLVNKSRGLYERKRKREGGK